MGIQVVSYHCTLKNRMGRVISSTTAQNVLLNPEGSQAPLRALSEAMRDLKKGEKRQVFLRADQAYGFYDPKLVLTRFLDESEFEQPLRLGERVQVIQNGQTISMRVTELSADRVTLDGNHPLAGQDLVFEIQALETREATLSDIGEDPDQPLLH